MRHVSSQLAAYAEGLLSAKQAKSVQEHILICEACREALILHEQLARDVRIALAVTPRQDQISQWWGAIQTAGISVPSAQHRSLWSATTMVPTLLAVFMVALPMLVGLTGKLKYTSISEGTYLAPAAVVTNLPPTYQINETQEPLSGETASQVVPTSAVYLAADSNSTDVPVIMIPAPLAP